LWQRDSFEREESWFCGETGEGGLYSVRVYHYCPTAWLDPTNVGKTKEFCSSGTRVIVGS